MVYRRLFKASEQHVPCLAHVLNLAVQAMLGKHGLGAEAPSDAESMDIEDDDETEGVVGFVRTSIMDGDDDADVGKAPQESTCTKDGALTKGALQKLRKGIVKIRYVLPQFVVL